MSDVDDGRTDEVPDDGREQPGSHRDDDAPWRHLHPASVVVNLIPRTWGVLKQAWPLLLVMLFGGRADGQGLFDLSIVGLLAGLAIVNTVVHWATLRYRLVGGRLEIVSGLMTRNRRVISPSKVQNVERVQNVFQRAAGLVEVRIETASGDEIEGLLSALGTDEADELMSALEGAHRAHDGTGEDDAGTAIVENGPLDLLRYGATSARLGAIAVGLGLLMEWTTFSDPTRLSRLGGWFDGLWGVAVAAAALVAAWGLAVATAFTRHHGFRLASRGDRLLAEEGLFTRRRVELAVPKVQLVSIRQPLLRRLLGFGSIAVETAAARAGSGGTERAETVVPVVGTDDVDRVLRHALPSADVDLATATLDRPDPRALKRDLVRGSVVGAAIVSGATWLWWPWGALSVIVAWVPAALDVLDWRTQGWTVTDEVIVSRRGWLDRTTAVVARSKLQSVELSQGPLQRRWGLGEVVLRVAGSAVPMPLLDHDVAFALAARLSASAAPRPAPPGAAGPARPG